jgi:hypothetical protein
MDRSAGIAFIYLVASPPDNKNGEAHTGREVPPLPSPEPEEEEHLLFDRSARVTARGRR